MWILIDNYDSFSHILLHYLLLTGNECVMIKNDSHTIAALESLNPTRLIISPGPQTPNEAGISLEAIKYFQNKIPILGVCLGHQAIGMLFGGKLKHNPQPVHGKTSTIQHNATGIFQGIDNPTTVMRYHSLRIETDYKSPLETIATTQDDFVIMGLQHKTLPIIGLQFHPESIGTPDGFQMLKNWAELYRD